MIGAAGILFVTPDGQALFLKRGDGGDFPGHWCFPGGTHEGEESAEATAVREANEEVGAFPNGERKFLCHIPIPVTEVAAATPGPAIGNSLLEAGPGSFVTFVQKIEQRFDPVLNDESTGFAWAPILSPPEPLHPGCRLALDMLTMDELGIARAMADGRLSSPQKYRNVTLFAIRITGTGVSYRLSQKEFVWRDPSIYLNDEFLARCSGLAVIWKHPPKATMDSQEYADRVIGSIMLPYIQGDEVWGIAKIYDDEAIALMSDKDNPLSTSPAVLIGSDKTNPKITLDGGEVLLIEGKPILLDHVAICEAGVWDKGGEPSGVNTSTLTGDIEMTDEEKKAAEEKARADAASAMKDSMDNILASVDAMAKRMDEVCTRMDSMEKAKADAEKTAEEKAAEEKAAEDKAKKDAEEAEEKAKADADRASAEERLALIQRIADLEAKIPKSPTEADYAALCGAQARADSIYQAHGRSAPAPLQGEDLSAYRRRIASDLKGHSDTWKAVDVMAIADDVAFTNIETQVYADAMSAALNPIDLPEGQLREVTTTDRRTGQRITTFKGKRSFVLDFARPRRTAKILRPQARA